MVLREQDYTKAQHENKIQTKLLEEILLNTNEKYQQNEWTVKYELEKCKRDMKILNTKISF